MATPSPFGPFAPGFEFLQGLVSNAGAALPGIGQWVAPTLDPEELEKRINELKTVQFWLEQNARMIGGTIQALEVQKLTLSTLKTMNVQMDDLRGSLKIRPTPDEQSSPSAAATSGLSTHGDSGAETATGDEPSQKAASSPPGVDPMQWWSTLTQQFTQLATEAMQKSAEDVSKHMAAGLQPAAAAAPAAAPKKSPARASDKSVGKSPKATSRKAPPPGSA